ncbi:TetR/AcrR family transcriptional regulator [Zhongshania aquimaris]|uniref:TetR/AcrR family transcriptional regulator n=1 Tax=Zhongshania aquimaris TaxID=2857107 RepID=A0ABS6VTS2_9GAMM|nr:TetR/AcrR family transcriptional regulator [Zhongshania aquimaris]MBW2941718.1 TetR/AcrR family transcriptional regulator [Zhongshania aquimaris]
MSVVKPSTGRKSKEDFINEAFQLIAEAGTAEALTIDSVCLRLGVSKGSFYWHFKGRDSLVDGLVEAWSGNFHVTIHRAIEAQTADNGRTIIEEISYYWLSSNMSKLDQVMRHWAQHDERVYKAVRRADELLLDFLKSNIKTLGYSENDSHRRARLMMAIGIAEPMLAHLPKVSEDADEIRWILDSVVGLNRN